MAKALRAAHRSMPYDATLVGANAADPGDSAAVDGISSVRIDFELSGYLAAKALLERGGGAIFGSLLAERRKSTRGRGRRATVVMEAVDTIRREACGGLTAAALIAHSGVPKSLFNLRFREAVGHSVRDEIEHVRLARPAQIREKPIDIRPLSGTIMGAYSRIIPQRVQFCETFEKHTRSGATMDIRQFVKTMRKQYHLTQVGLAESAGVGLRFVRELEAGKPTLRMDKVNAVLDLFGARLGPVPVERESLESINRIEDA